MNIQEATALIPETPLDISVDEYEALDAAQAPISVGQLRDLVTTLINVKGRLVALDNAIGQLVGDCERVKSFAGELVERSK